VSQVSWTFVIFRFYTPKWIQIFCWRISSIPLRTSGSTRTISSSAYVSVYLLPAISHVFILLLFSLQLLFLSSTKRSISCIQSGDTSVLEKVDAALAEEKFWGVRAHAAKSCSRYPSRSCLELLSRLLLREHVRFHLFHAFCWWLRLCDASSLRRRIRGRRRL
jgi:hypothetical protein